MRKLAIYENSDGGISVIIPMDGFNIYDVARKDIPAGTEYWIVDESTFPEDRYFRDAWTIDRDVLGAPDGVAIGHEAWALEQEATNDKN